ncbi:ParB/RepB/Spo0J family partition protein [Desulfomicrobium salsuginis]
MGNYELGQVYDLELSTLKPNPHQPRTVFQDTEIRELANSIDEKGLLQPILVKELEDGQIIIVSGERRFRAHQLLERETIPAWFTTGDPEELALVENLVREDLSAMETAEALKKLADRFGLKTNDDIGKVIGKAPSTVSEILSLNDLSENIRNKIRGDKKFALRELKKIASQNTPKAQEKLFKAYEAKIETESLKKATRARLTGEALHKKKVQSIRDYFTKMSADDKILELSSLREELSNLKDGIEIILNNLIELNSKFDASKVEEASSKPKKKKK